MAKTFSMGVNIESRPKKTRQGNGKHSKYADSTSRNSDRKRPRGQGK